MSKTTNKFSSEVRERAVRLVLDNQNQHGSRWQAVLSISSKIGCAPQTLNDWVKKAEVDSGKRPGVSSEMAEKMKALERENRELRQANEILRKASAYFAMAELVLWNPWLLRQKGVAARHRKLRGSGGGGVVRSLVLQDRGRV
ncbi:Transposase [Paracoccus nototheniae]